MTAHRTNLGLALALVPTLAAAAGLREYDFAGQLEREVADQCGVQRAVELDQLEFVDVDGDGEDEAIVVASTCMTGTAGPDVHAVYKAGSDGTVRELPFEETPETTHPRLAGNRNYTLHAVDGLLLREYTDNSDRARPRTEYFRWERDRFRLVRIEKAPTFPTSFDCARAANDAEVTLCGSAELAALDRALAAAYERARERAKSAARRELVEGQRAWVAARDRECVYKRIPECLRERYQRRLAELGGAAAPAR